ncbi:MAG TPA: 23S rRNA (adenine(2503)-C(2))-methyltransferase RlmN [Desulfovibrio sp.]|uniref:23S rRNA (adenine(2503)-C(2))-methyltransferase RlmN n=1 Tax=Desulfovibrio sp. TaxID=885 RepID=UPI002B95B2D5|nr:23S rRNA (adenine(2503)-C(2))-methyltransferase RlmN [Desulfovibrio sp.]HMM38033.1 23S rRNA (adenine(2503)-C(2))-methyltransferase RlmN [Desulfovibrio sp.]
MLNLLDLTFSELESFFVEDVKEPRFRAAQVWQWLWQKDARDFAAMTNLSKILRDKLAARAAVAWPEVADVRASRDGTIKFLLRLGDGKLIESVLIPNDKLARYTQCLSTQVGCAMACTFCNTGLMGFERNLTQGEILGQILVGRAHLAASGLAPLTNLVFMGMGEPLLNLDWLLKSLATLNSDTGLNISWRRTTVSSVGLPKGLDVLGASGLALPAISLHAPTQELRARIMPKAAQVPLDELLAALDRYPMKPRERITFEYLLLRGINDSPAHARQLHKLLCNRRCKVNLIAYNATEDSPYQAPDPDAVLAFEKILWDKGMTATIRRSMGTDIKAACGQLKAESVRD